MSRRPIRVLRIIARLNVGGPALQVSSLVDGLDQERFEHRVVIGSTAADEADFRSLRASHLEVVEIDGLGRAVRPGDDLRALRALRREIDHFRPDIVHTHTAKAGLLGRLATWTAGGARTVHTFHGHLLHGYGSTAAAMAVRATEAALARRTDVLVSVGSRVRDELLAAGVGRPHQYVVVPPGIPTMTCPDEGDARVALGLDADGLVVVFVARLTTVKRPDRFLEVAARLVERFPTCTFLVVGGGPLLEEVRRDAAAVGPNVQVLGWRADLDVVLAAADVAVLTSDNEGMPVSLIEAAMAGIPAVTTDVGSAAEVVLHGETGLAVPPSVTAIADAVGRLLADPALRARMGAAASARATRSFSGRRLVEDLAAVYESLVRGN